MHKLLVTFLFLFTVQTVFSQKKTSKPQFGDKKEIIIYKLTEYLDQINCKGIIKDLDSSIELQVTMPVDDTVHFTYYLDKEKKLYAYEYSNCDTCVKQYLQSLLANNHYKWMQINANTYLSRYSKSELIEIYDHPGNFRFTVRKVNMPKKKFKELYSTKI